MLSFTTVSIGKIGIGFLKKKSSLYLKFYLRHHAGDVVSVGHSLVSRQSETNSGQYCVIISVTCVLRKLLLKKYNFSASYWSQALFYKRFNTTIEWVIITLSFSNLSNGCAK